MQFEVAPNLSGTNFILWFKTSVEATTTKKLKLKLSDLKKMVNT